MTIGCRMRYDFNELMQDSPCRPVLSTRPLTVFLLLLLLTCAGCLPYSCNRTESRALLPADSLSREIATLLPIDTLRLFLEIEATEDLPLEYPRTLLFDEAGRLYVSDVQRNSIFVFDEHGTVEREITDTTFAYPYLAGIRGDTLLVFNPEAHRLDWWVDNYIAHQVNTPTDRPARGGLQYVTASSEALFYKVIAEDFEHYIARLNHAGAIQQRTLLDGPHWQHAGMLRMWGDTLLSLSGYRPVLNVMGEDGVLHTRTLVGFDSPSLARSRLFMIGETHQPPLLTAAAAASDSLLFVLNMRPGWLRVDTYDHAGQVQHIYTQENPAFNNEYYPIDLAVHPLPTGYRIAVAVLKPAPRIDLYTLEQP